MRKTLFITLFLLLLTYFPGKSNDMQALFSYSTFFNHQEGSYIETYMNIYGKSVDYEKKDNGMFQASVQVTIIFKDGDKIIDFRKYNLLSPEVADTSGIIPDFIDQQRIALPDGIYNLELNLVDNNKTDNNFKYKDVFELSYTDENLKFGGIQLVESIQKTEKANKYSKSGYDLHPLAMNFFPSSMPKLIFYTEVYNLDKKLFKEEPFLFKYYLESFSSNKVLSEFSKFQKQEVSSINALIGIINITSLPSGNYNLVIEVRDKKNELVGMNKSFIQRSNPGVQINLADLDAIDINATFAEKITEKDSLSMYIRSLRPIANILDKNFIDKNLKGSDLKLLQQFFYNFWTSKEPTDPEGAWKIYKKNVILVENEYGTKFRKGFETDIGRVYLQYGPPNQMEEGRFEPAAPPYIIWHYYQLGDQRNKRFIFYNPELTGIDYILLHSDARGEIYNPNWEVDLHSRAFMGQEVQSHWGGNASWKYKK